MKNQKNEMKLEEEFQFKILPWDKKGNKKNSL